MRKPGSNSESTTLCCEGKLCWVAMARLESIGQVWGLLPSCSPEPPQYGGKVSENGAELVMLGTVIEPQQIKGHCLSNRIEKRPSDEVGGERTELLNSWRGAVVLGDSLFQETLEKLLALLTCWGAQAFLFALLKHGHSIC